MGGLLRCVPAAVFVAFESYRLEAAGVPLPLPSNATRPLHGVSQWDMIRTGAPSARNEVLLNIDPLQPTFAKPVQVRMEM